MNVTNRYITYLCNLYEYYEKKLNSFLESRLGETDPRTSQWPFTRSPIPLLTMFTLYYIIAIFGPRIMKNQKALEIRKILMIYNVAQIWLSSFIVKEILISSYQVGFSLTCQPVDVSMNPDAVRMASSSWWYHISKYVDLLDTVFFVLRKKGKQMTFLHLFHHSTMLFNSYLGMLYLPGGQAIVSTFLNSFVHVIMYWYYLLSSVGPSFHRYLWWKKYLTILQLTQFFTILAHMFLGSLSGCQVPNWLKLYVICYLSVLIVLFLNFYLSSYNKMSLLKAVGCVCFPTELKKSFELKEKSSTLDKEIKLTEEENNKMSLLKAVGCVCFPTELKKSFELKEKSSTLDKEIKLTEEEKLLNQNKIDDTCKKEGARSKSPFTLVNRNVRSESSERSLGDSVADKDKDI